MRPFEALFSQGFQVRQLEGPSIAQRSGPRVPLAKEILDKEAIILTCTVCRSSPTNENFSIPMIAKFKSKYSKFTSFLSSSDVIRFSDASDPPNHNCSSKRNSVARRLDVPWHPNDCFLVQLVVRASLAA